MKTDPSRTTSLRRAFEREIRVRFASLRRVVVAAVLAGEFPEPAPVVNAFEPGNRFAARSASPSRAGQEADATAKGRFAFKTDDKKLASFNRWVAAEAKKKVLEVEPKTGKPWVGKYVQSAYKKGLLRGYVDARGKNLASKTADAAAGSKAEFLRAAFSAPERLSKVRLLGTRAFEELKGVTAKMSTQLNRALSNGMIRGDSPRTIAAQMAKEIDGLSRSRALLIARTEVIHAHAEGQLDSFADLGIEGVAADVEFSTAGDDKVCEECSDLNGKTYTVAEARGVIPVHPNCVVGETRVRSPSPLSIMRGIYSGTLIDLVTAKGRRLSVTAQHVLLTQRGWVRARELTELDQLVDAAALDPALGEDDHEGVAVIADRFAAAREALAEAGVEHATAEVAAPDFHGDGEALDREVEVVPLDGLLRHQDEPGLRGEGVHGALVLRGVAAADPESLDRERALAQRLLALAGAADSLMGFHGVASVRRRGALAHHEPVRRRRAADRHVAVLEDPTDDVAVALQAPSEGSLAGPGLVELDDLLRALGREEVLPRLRESLAAGAHDAASREALSEAFRAALKLLGHDRDREPGQVERGGVVFDQIEAVGSRHVRSLPVYDMETHETIYSANGVLSSNCRCAWIPAVEAFATSGSKKKEADEA